MAHLTSLRLGGWKSIRDATIELRPLNVLIGANGAGKSNVVSFFKMLQEGMGGRLKSQIATAGGAEALLHYGAKRTPALEAALRFAGGNGETQYSLRLIPAASNSLVIEHEIIEHLQDGLVASSSQLDSGGHRELFLSGAGDLGDPMENQIRESLSRCRVFHFHDTSLLGPMRRDCFIDANRFLYSDAANLPAMLYLYHGRFPTAYHRIVAAVKAVAPFFEDFVLEPLRLNPQNIALHWRAKASDYELEAYPGTGIGSEYAFGAHQLSDGTLRAIALFTLLLQPEEDLPALIVLDEPELGLHPAALAVLADLLKSASRHSQLLVATQSAALIDHFDADDIVTVNLRDGCSTFKRLDPKELKDWLDEYTISELWARNVIGGGPY